MRPRQNFAALWVVVIVAAALARGGAAERAAVVGEGAPSPRTLAATPAYRLLDRLLERPEQVSVLQASSHNKKGENGDASWPLYKDKKGDDVIFDAAGPGCVRSMWGTAFDPAGVMQFYFDGEDVPRYTISCVAFYQGKLAPFPVPLASYERRGRWGDEPLAGNCFAPIPFEKWLKISVRGESRFFHIIYETYPFGTPIKTFTGQEDRRALLDAFEGGGKELVEAEGLEITKVETGEVVAPGTSVTLYKAEGAPGVVRRIVLEADGSEAFFRDTQIRMRWDGHTLWDVQAPAGIFFGSAVEADDTRSLALRVEKLESGRVRLRCYFPMPFWKSAEIVWVNTSRRPLTALRAEIAVGRDGGRASEGLYFTTLYREGTTTYGRDWLLFDGRGTGWFVGVVQSMQWEHYCEGNEHFSLDGAISPQINGTGTEDYYLACFWSNVDFDSPFACVVGDVMLKGGGTLAGAYAVPSCYSRFHLEAPIPFYAAVDARIQHGGVSQILSRYRSLAFSYLRKRPAIAPTDSIDVGNLVSERAHAYRATKSGEPLRLKARPEGEHFDGEIEATGRSHAGGEIVFTAAIDPDNRGIRLRRRLDQAGAPQKAQVYVNGRYAGCWYHGYQNPFLRWYDTDFDIRSDLTKGLATVDIKLAVETGEGLGPFTDFDYTIYSFGS